ncbi:MBL fold metallo-hydrolase [Maridesulfovibrio salexigens]|uniref:Beta-lactamase domain protein n=1 Tax=Maridesulfovibrio salexigens (strain ATCC 14822 / DSM 2638 / NCIMB 8403 / VKM B-1763) TaxID=526222 RepID=C6BV84_MARSD|nr:MBL fold metallo-hydrolase [Maridesulfovibrio salexigens]ACS80059.1 beta-lactamase domain protein [Maridesulfovibrio salexigens DSM 2638]
MAIEITGQYTEPCKISVLCDNESLNSSLGKEWGLSMALELPGNDLWLWDCSASDLFLKNADVMNIDVSKAKGLALSHGHWDHTGGMDALMEADFMGPVYAHPDFANKRYSKEDDGSAKDASFQCEYPGTIIVRDDVKLEDGLFMITEIPRREGLFEATKDLFIDQQMTEVDHVRDDAFMLLMSKSGPVVVLGCCHSGLANSLYHMRDLTGIDSVHAIIGGLHLYSADKAEYEKTAKVIEEFNPKMISPGHCTGKDGFEFLKKRLSCEVVPMGSGSVYEF